MPCGGLGAPRSEQTPGGLDEDPAGTAMAGLGDRAALLALTRAGAEPTCLGQVLDDVRGA